MNIWDEDTEVMRSHGFTHPFLQERTARGFLPEETRPIYFCQNVDKIYTGFQATTERVVKELTIT